MSRKNIYRINKVISIEKPWAGELLHNIKLNFRFLDFFQFVT